MTFCKSALAGVLLLCACISRPPRGFIPKPQADPAGIAGRYCFSGAVANVRRARPPMIDATTLREQPDLERTLLTSGFTVLPLVDVIEGTVVELATGNDSVTVHYENLNTGRRNSLRYPVDRSRTLPAGALAVRSRARGGGASMGIGVRRRWVEFTRTPEGRLLVVEHYTERGLGLLVIPFADHLAWVAELDPAGACRP